MSLVLSDSDLALFDATFQEERIERRAALVPTHVGGDAGMHNPFWYEDQTLTADNEAMYVSQFASENMLDKRQLWAAATKSPQGHFITFVAAIDAFRNEWKYIEYKGYTEVSEDLKKKLTSLKKDYNIKQIHTMAAGTARALGKCIVAKVKQKSYGYKKLPKIKLRVFPIFDWEIDWDDETGEPIQYNPMASVGLKFHRFNIPAKDAIMYVHKVDPFGNGYQGIPEVYTIYNQLKWLANIERGWAEAMDSRGISMLQFKIPGYHPNQYEKWKNAYGDPTKYHVAFTDDETDIVGVPGVNSTFDLNSTVEAFTKETAAGSGMAQSRIDGTQRGQVSGGQTDTDNYYSILNTIQEEFEPQLISLHEFLDKTVIDTFDISWDIEPKLDKFSKAQIRAANVSTIQTGLDLITYNQALEMLDLPKVGEEGDIPASIYIFNMQQDAGMILSPEDEIKMGNSQEGKGEFETPESKKSSGVNRKQNKKPPKKPDEENRGGDRGKGKDSNQQQCKARLASGRRCLNFTTNPDGYCWLHEGGKRGGKWGGQKYHQEAERRLKERKAKYMRNKGDSYEKINTALKKEFKEGYSNTTLYAFDSELRDERKKLAIMIGDARPSWKLTEVERAARIMLGEKYETEE